MKRCGLCHQELPLSNFYTTPKGRVWCWCRDCNRTYRRENSYRYRDAARAYRTANSARVTAERSAWRAAHIERVRAMKRRWATANAERLRPMNRAKCAVRRAVRRGDLVRPPACEACGAIRVAIEAAHSDYSRPLDVRWLCIPCHRRWDHAEPKTKVQAS